MGPLPARAGGEQTPLPSDLELVVRGGGWGHGHGMSQYGARSAAESGMNTAEILHHYYTGVDIADRGNPRIRVLLSSKRSLVVGGPERVSARWEDGTPVHTSTAEDPFIRARATDGGVMLYRGPSVDGPWTKVGASVQHARFTSDEGPVTPVWRSGRIEYFRGEIQAYRRSATSLYLINELRLNAYLFGVVPREMPASWPAFALRAQAVAARSYTLWKRGSVGGSASYHICATTMCQVYRGYGLRTSIDAPLEVLEHPRTTDAIARTSGNTMVYPGEGPIFAEYNSSSGGHTSEGSRPYLAPVPDPHDATYSPYHRWSTGVTVASVERHWPSIGRLAGISITGRDGYGAFGGRVTSMDLVGTDGTVTVSGPTFRSALGLRSSLFTIDLYDAAPEGAAAEVALAPGTTTDVELLVRNTGTAAWPVGDDVRLGTSRPRARASAFRAPDWLSKTRVTGIAEDVSDGDGSVAPGQVAAFRFQIAVPAGLTPGLYREWFSLVTSGSNWFGREIALPVRVGFDGIAHLGGNVALNPSFEALDGPDVAAWEPVMGPAALLSDVAIDGGSSLQVPAVAAGATRVRQTVARGGRAGDRFVLSAWHRGAATVDGRGRTYLTAVTANRDGTQTRATVVFPAGAHDWTYGEAELIADRRFDSIELTLATLGQTGDVWFDRVAVVRQSIVNGGFEADGVEPAAWRVVNGEGRAIVTGRVRQGTRALRLDGAPRRNTYARQYRTDVAGKAGSRLRLGGWSRVLGSDAGGGPVQLRARLHHTDGTRSIHVVAFPRTPHDWVFGETVIQAPKAFRRVDVYARYANQTGAAQFDDIVLAPVGASPSVADNGGFELGAPSPATWALVHIGSEGAATSDTASRGSASLHVRGLSATDRYARQNLPVGGDAGERYTLSGWNRTVDSDASGGPVRIWVRVIHADGTYRGYVLDFPRASHDWTFRERTFTTEKPYVEMRVFARYSRQTGDAWFDAISVHPAV